MPTEEAFRADAAHLLEGVVQRYDWGSLDAIPALLGQASDGSPQAELWLGAHQRAPALVGGSRLDLDQLVRSQPVEVLGERVARHHDGQLPFLLKLLSAAKPLSIQAHPDLEMARAGWAREEAEGIPRDSPQRNYKDPNHKPELLVALTRFHALKRFRPLAQILERTAAAGPALAPARAALEARADEEGLRAFVDALLSLGEDERGSAIEHACVNAGEPWIAHMAREFPGDAGALAPLFLQHVELAPGEGLYLRARELHTYLEGTGLELMASSDNVLRGGCTSKHIDRAELCRVLRFEPQQIEVLRAEPASDGSARWRTPAREFELSLLELAEGSAWSSQEERGAEVLLCTRGELRITTRAGELPLARGAAALLPAAARSYTLEGAGCVYRARVPELA